MPTRTIFVYENWSASAPVIMGYMYVESLRGKEACSFEYAPE